MKDKKKKGEWESKENRWVRHQDQDKEQGSAKKSGCTAQQVMRNMGTREEVEDREVAGGETEEQ